MLGSNWKFRLGDRVYKPRGSYWEGTVVGFYSTDQTPRGYNVQAPAPNNNGAVQIYPEAALEALERRSKDQEPRQYVDGEPPEWARWKGEGPPPPSWWAVDPKTGERTKVYRSYSDYC